MRNIKASIIAVCLFTCLLVFSLYTEAHSGGTDWKGGHKNHATGEYHYHHGYPAHGHYDIDGDGTIDCPYTFDYDSMSEAESETSFERIEFSIPEYSFDYSIPTFSYPEYTPIPEYYKTKSEASHAPPAYVTLSMLGVVFGVPILIATIAYILERRRK